jgi:hypothetical protein
MSQCDDDLLAILKHVDGVLISKGGWCEKSQAVVLVAEVEWDDDRLLGVSMTNVAEAVASLREQVEAKLQEVRS